ncbi:MAG: hypothetical protein HY738_21345 [Bacteroidia bacterium]|nr:hypothetical protein [Bacteroidia bacterium]
MNTIKRILQKQIALSLIITLIALVSCRKDLTDTINITEFKWMLKSINIDNEILKPENKDYLRDDAYNLIFESDTNFIFNTSVNIAGGTFNITEKGKISIFLYEEFTEVGTNDNEEKKLNENLILIFSTVTNYKVLGNTLSFKGENSEVKLKKQ